MTGRITHLRGTVRFCARSLFAQGRTAAAWAALCSQAKYRIRAAMARFLPAASGLRRAISGKPSGFLGIFKKRRKILQIVLTSGGGCGILSMWLAMTNRSADTERRRTWERRTLRDPAGRRWPQKELFSLSAGAWVRPQAGLADAGHDWDKSSLFPLISCFPHERPRTDAIPSGAKRRPFPVVRSGSGRRFFQKHLRHPWRFCIIKTAMRTGRRPRRANKKEESLC